MQTKCSDAIGNEKYKVQWCNRKAKRKTNPPDLWSPTTFNVDTHVVEIILTINWEQSTRACLVGLGKGVGGSGWPGPVLQDPRELHGGLVRPRPNEVVGPVQPLSVEESEDDHDDTAIGTIMFNYTINIRLKLHRIHNRLDQSWALLVFWVFSIIKNDFFCIFYQVNSLFLHQSYLKSPLPVKLTG